MGRPQDQSLGTRTIHGMLWAYGAYVGGRAIVLVSTAILARLLTPADFGVVALALVFMTFMETVQDFGLTQALVVASPEEESARAQTTFMWTVAIGAALAIVASACGPLVAQFFAQPMLRAIIPVLGLSFFLESVGATHDSLARKHLDYRTRAIAQGANVLTRGTTGVVLALAGFGAWSLVLGYLVGTIARTVTLWILVSFRPKLRFTRGHLEQPRSLRRDSHARGRRFRAGSQHGLSVRRQGARRHVLGSLHDRLPSARTAHHERRRCGRRCAVPGLCGTEKRAAGERLPPLPAVHSGDRVSHRGRTGAPRRTR